MSRWKNDGMGFVRDSRNLCLQSKRIGKMPYQVFGRLGF